MKLPRASGILLHPTSLPGRFGNGDLGPEAHAFVDFLAETGQKWWQTLPLGPTGYGSSPYQSPSSFAGNPLLISPDGLVATGWLDDREIADLPHLPEDYADFEAAAELKLALLHRAFERFKAGGRNPLSRCSAPRIMPGSTNMSSSRPSATPTTACPGTNGSRGSSVATPRSAPDGARSWPTAWPSTSSCSIAFEIQWRQLRVACQAKGDPADRRRADLRGAGQRRCLGSSRAV